ncbi:MAG: four helix bundle protein [Bacteroidaceae bacterium]|jgi:four helix bundle protein|nr:four helix bundle protein [Bacteroidaceae bacterium]
MYENVESPLSQKSEAFSGRIINMVRFLHKEKDKCLGSLYNQVLRSGTSIAANIAESQFAQSPADFITKLHIALKEANETRKWLNMLRSANCLTSYQYDSMNADLSEIIAMLVSSVNTSKRNQSIIIKS